MLVTQSCPTLCDSIDCSLSWDFPGKNTGVVGGHFLLQGIFSTEALNTDLSHYRHILYCLTPREDSVQFSSIQSLSCDRLFVTPWITARQASLSITNSKSLLKLMSIESWRLRGLHKSQQLNVPELSSPHPHLYKTVHSVSHILPALHCEMYF